MREVLPEKRLAAGKADPVKAGAGRNFEDAGDLFEAEDLLVREDLLDALGQAIATAELATVRDRDAERAVRAAVRIDEKRHDGNDIRLSSGRQKRPARIVAGRPYVGGASGYSADAIPADSPGGEERLDFALDEGEAVRLIQEIDLRAEKIGVVLADPSLHHGLGLGIGTELELLRNDHG
jgi:hypothetical protein